MDRDAKRPPRGEPFAARCSLQRPVASSRFGVNVLSAASLLASGFVLEGRTRDYLAYYVVGH